MSPGDLAVSLTLKLNDQGSTPARQALKTIERSLKEVETAAKSSSSAAISAFKKLADSREILGIRSEKAIQNEIRQTEAAYKRLVASGQAGARELARAQDAMRGKVQALRQEMEGASRAGVSLGGALRGGAALGAGAMAGRAVLAGPVSQTMSYDRALANLSNTAYAGESLDTRRSGMRSLDAAVTAAVRAGGGTREGALGALDKLVASGVYANPGDAARALPTLVRGGTASAADPALLADIAIRGRQTFGMNDPARAIDMAMKAGQLGGFELKDMAKWLPQQMAMARQSGLRGEGGFATLLAANQAAAITAGTKDEAGNNLVNLLAKINSQDTAKDAKKLGIDLSGTLAAAAGKGVNGLDAFVNLVEQIVAKDKSFGAMKTKAASAKGDEKQAAFTAQADILQGSAVGKIIQDRQALMALVGIMNNRGYVNDVRSQTMNAGGTADSAFSLISETPSYKAEQLAAEKAIAMQNALDKVNPALGGMADGLAGIMKEWPGFSAAVVGGTTALTALAAAAGAAAISMGVLGGGGVKGVLGGLASGAAGAGRAALGAAGRVGAGALGAVLSPVGAAAMAGGGIGLGVGTLANLGINKADKAFGTSVGNDIGRMVAYVMAGLGSRGAKEALQIEIDVKNGNIVAAVNQANAREAARK